MNMTTMYDVHSVTTTYSTVCISPKKGEIQKVKDHKLGGKTERTTMNVVVGKAANM